jgi:hypothetical protein
MASKLKVDAIETGDGTGTIALSNQFTGMTVASLPTLTTTEIPTLTSSHMPAGSVIQVVSRDTAAVGSVTVNSSSTTLNPDIYATITPIKSGSKILVIVRWTGDIECAAFVAFNVLRDGTNFASPGTAYHQGITTPARSPDGNIDIAHFHTMDTTVTTASTARTYRLVASRDSNSATVYTNKRTGGGEVYASEMVLMEISS